MRCYLCLCLVAVYNFQYFSLIFGHFIAFIALQSKFYTIQDIVIKKLIATKSVCHSIFDLILKPCLKCCTTIIFLRKEIPERIFGKIIQNICTCPGGKCYLAERQIFCKLSKIFLLFPRKAILERGKWYHNSNSMESNHLIRYWCRKWKGLLGEDLFIS